MQLGEITAQRPKKQSVPQWSHIEIINQMHRGKHIDGMTKKWLLQTPNPLEYQYSIHPRKYTKLTGR